MLSNPLHTKSNQEFNPGFISLVLEDPELKLTHPVLEEPWVLCRCLVNGRWPQFQWQWQDCGCLGSSRNRTRLFLTQEDPGLTETPEKRWNIETDADRSHQTELLYKPAYSSSRLADTRQALNEEHIIGQGSRLLQPKVEDSKSSIIK